MSRIAMVTLGLVAAGCCGGDGSREVSLSFEDFEDCSTPLCGVTVLGGRAQLVETWHAGQRALDLRDDAHVRMPEAVSGSGSWLGIDAIVDCEADSYITARASLEGEARDVVFEPCCGDRVTRQRFGFGAVSDGRATFELLLAGPGPCTVDDVEILGSRDPGCD